MGNTKKIRQSVLRKIEDTSEDFPKFIKAKYKKIHSKEVRQK